MMGDTARRQVLPWRTRAIRIGVAIFRHLLALGGTAALGAVYAAVLYTAGLVMSIVMNLGLGGPFAPFFMTLLGLVWALAYGALVCLPLAAVGEFLLRRKPPRVWGFVGCLVALAAMLLSGLLAFPVMGALGWGQGGPNSSGYAEVPLIVPFVLVPLAAPPLAYWSVLRGLAWLLTVLARRFPSLALYTVCPESTGPQPA